MTTGTLRLEGRLAAVTITVAVGLVRGAPAASSAVDRGYRASNAVSGSRFDVPIRELPFAIQAFTESFIKDQKAQNIFDVARFSPGVTYRSNDFNEGNANLAIRGERLMSVDLMGKNLTDEHYRPSQSTRGRPREFMLAIKASL